jgi:hypothetical protein
METNRKRSSKGIPKAKLFHSCFRFFSEGVPCLDVYAVLVPIWDPFELLLVALGSILIPFGRFRIHFGIPFVALPSILACEMYLGATYDPKWSQDAPRPDPHWFLNAFIIFWLDFVCPDTCRYMQTPGSKSTPSFIAVMPPVALRTDSSDFWGHRRG